MSVAGGLMYDSPGKNDIPRARAFSSEQSTCQLLNATNYERGEFRAEEKGPA